MPYLLILLFNKSYKSFLFIFFFHLLIWACFSFFFNFHLINNSRITFFVLPTLLITLKDIFFPIKDLRKEDSLVFSYIFSLIWSCIYLSTILTTYIKGLDYNDPIRENLDMLLLWVTSALQGKIFLSTLHSKNNLLLRLKSLIINEWVIFIDLVFSIILLSMIIFRVYTNIELIFFLYGFRLVRILLLVPYFDEVWNSIKRGIKLTGNYVTSFIVILFIFSINSRILFSKANNNFSDIPTSVYTNFKIILGNGFDLVDNIDKNLILVIYIFSVTLIIGIIFTSTITALITDSLIIKKETNINKTEVPIWYKKHVDENNLLYIIRLIQRIASI
jgi:hypothetical protein